MSVRETALTFPCAGETLVGIVHRPARAARRGVLIVVGGPQYRVGSHRQFVRLARSLAGAGVPVMRFDYRGMGDSGGEPRSFEAIDDDIAAAMDCFMAEVEGLEELVLWGLCDGASAILFCAFRDPRISGIVLVNPWVRTEQSLGAAQLRHYYRRRLIEPAFWRKLLGGEVEVGAAIAALLGSAIRMLGARLPRPRQAAGGAARPASADLPTRMAEGLARFRGPVLLILSGNDITAREFEDVARRSRAWRRLLRDRRVTQHRLEAADHTFAQDAWQSQMTSWVIDWLAAEPVEPAS